MTDWHAPINDTSSSRWQHTDQQSAYATINTDSNRADDVARPFEDFRLDARSHTPQRLHMDDLRASPTAQQQPRSDMIYLESTPVLPGPSSSIASSSSSPSSVSTASSATTHTHTPILEPAPLQHHHQQRRPSWSITQFVTGLRQPRASTNNDDVRAYSLSPPYAAVQRTPSFHQRLSTPRRTFEEMLPRRSLLAPHDAYAIDRRTLDPTGMFRATATAQPSPQQQRQHQPHQLYSSPSMRHMDALRPVGSPALLPPHRHSTASRASQQQQLIAATDPLAALLHRRFATKRVRHENAWLADLWFYLKNTHPVLALATAHRQHPYKRRDRVLVLLVALLVLFIGCGIVATQPCCSTALNDDAPLAQAATRRLDAVDSSLRTHYQQQQHCQSFYSACDDITSLCTIGSHCIDQQCVPDNAVAAAMPCRSDRSPSECPLGWTCDTFQQQCQPTTTTLVCYTPRSTATTAKALQLAATDATDADANNNDVSVIEAVFQILIIANNATTSSTNDTHATTPSTSASIATSAVPIATPVPSPSPPPPSTTQSLSIALLQPTDGRVYSVAATMAIEWDVRLLSTDTDAAADSVSAAQTQPFDAFTVAFSADSGATFRVIAADVRAQQPLSGPSSLFRFVWNMANDEAFVCTDCVLRVCAADDGRSSAGASENPLCIRSDANDATNVSKTSANVSKLGTRTTTNGIHFHIVREHEACTCGIGHTTFVPHAFVVALLLPLALLLLEQLVTFYEDEKLGGLVARRRRQRSDSLDRTSVLQCGAVSTAAALQQTTRTRPLLGYYDPQRATRVGRVVLVLLLVAACVGSGVVLARVTTTTFFDQTRAIALLWAALFGLCVLVGCVYVSVVYVALFSWRYATEASSSETRTRGATVPLDADRVAQLSDFELTRHEPQQEQHRQDFGLL